MPRSNFFDNFCSILALILILAGMTVLGFLLCRRIKARAMAGNPVFVSVGLGIEIIFAALTLFCLLFTVIDNYCNINAYPLWVLIYQFAVVSYIAFSFITVYGAIAPLVAGIISLIVECRYPELRVKIKKKWPYLLLLPVIAACRILLFFGVALMLDLYWL